MKKVFIVIPNWNGANYLKDCLNSLRDLDYDNYRVVVADNGSSDASLDLIRDKFPDVHVVEIRDNLGFAAGCNRGIKYSLDRGAEYVLLLNNDTVVDKNFVKEMVKVAENEDAGIVGSKIYYFEPKNKIWFAGGVFVRSRASGKHKLWGGSDREDLIGVRDSDFITGCVMLIRKDVFEKIGYFYEPYFLGVEDLDFCYQAKEKGTKIKVALDAKVWHKVSFSRSGEFSFSNGYYGTRNRLYFAFKRTGNIFGGLVLLFVVAPIRTIQWLLMGRFTMIRGMWLGIIDFSRGRLGKYKD